MAAGDWGSGASILLGPVRVEFKPGTAVIQRVTVAYQVLLPSGASMFKDWEWTPPAGAFPALPTTATFADVVAAIGGQLAGDLCLHEGIPLFNPTPAPATP